MMESFFHIKNWHTRSSTGLNPYIIAAHSKGLCEENTAGCRVGVP
jgi:hypothetical protein